MRSLPSKAVTSIGLSLLASLTFWPGVRGNPAVPKSREFIVRIRDEATGKPTAARLRVTDAYHQYIAPYGYPRRVEKTSRGANLILRDGRIFAYVDGKCRIALPYGHVGIRVMKGPEYVPIDTRQVIDDRTPEVLELKLQRWIDMKKQGWYSGDSHVHFPPDLRNIHPQMSAEGLNIANVLTMRYGDETGSYFWNTQNFNGGLDSRSTPDHLIYVNEEFRNHFLGHLVLFNLKKIVWPISTGGPGENEVGGEDYPTMAEVADQVHDQEGLVSWAHFDYPSGELTTDVALGKIDAVDLLTVGNPLRRDPVHAAFL